MHDILQFEFQYMKVILHIFIQIYSDEVLEEFERMTSFGLAMDAQLTTPHVERDEIPLQTVSLVKKKPRLM